MNEYFQGEIIALRAVENCALQLWGQRRQRDHATRMVVHAIVRAGDLFDRDFGLEILGPSMSIGSLSCTDLVWFGFGLSRDDLFFLITAGAGEFAFFEPIAQMARIRCYLDAALRDRSGRTTTVEKLIPNGLIFSANVTVFWSTGSKVMADPSLNTLPRSLYRVPGKDICKKSAEQDDCEPLMSRTKYWLLSIDNLFRSRRAASRRACHFQGLGQV